MKPSSASNSQSVSANLDTEANSRLFVKNDRVRLTGMRTAPNFNDTMWTVQEFDSKSGRWYVRSDLDGKLKWLKPEYLKRVEPHELWYSNERSNDRYGDTRGSSNNLKEGSRIKFVGLTKLEHFNESYGTVVRFDSELNRWLCRADLDNKLKWMKADNIRIVEWQWRYEGRHQQVQVDSNWEDGR